jgi:beta-lactam-binding protein with PASTA domain
VAGNVISQDPTVCVACVPPGSSVDLVISTGPAANVPPVAEDDFASVRRKQQKIEALVTTINLTDNDSDSDGFIDTTSVVILIEPTQGTIVNNGDGTVDYTPTRRKGTFNLTYTVNDNEGATSNVATLRINVTN